MFRKKINYPAFYTEMDTYIHLVLWMYTGNIKPNISFYIFSDHTVDTILIRSLSYYTASRTKIYIFWFKTWILGQIMTYLIEDIFALPR